MRGAGLTLAFAVDDRWHNLGVAEEAEGFTEFHRSDVLLILAMGSYGACSQHLRPGGAGWQIPGEAARRIENA